LISENLKDLDIQAIIYGDLTQELTSTEIQLGAIHQYRLDTKGFKYV